MRIPLPPAVPLFLAACSLLAACSGPYAEGRLAPRGVPGISGGGNGKERATADGGGPGEPGVAVTALSKVPPARVTESEVLAHVEALGKQHGRPGLLALEPGSTLVDRLRYCTSRILLGRTKDVLPELERLAVDHPDNPLVWRQLGYAKYWVEARDAADRCMRKAYELAKRDDFATCPTLPSFLGQLLLEREETREEGIRRLRDELATGKDYSRACWALAIHFSERERHADALACLDAAMERESGNEQLMVAKAKVLLELHKPDEVLKLLEPLVDKPSTDRFAIETMMRARELRREFGPAIVLMDRLLARSDLSAAEKETLKSRREELVEAKRTGFKKLLRDWEVYAILRGHPDLRVRRRLLRNVVEQDNVRVREHSLHIAFNSESPVLRAEALILLIPQSTAPLANVRAGLKDENGKVRGTAAILAAAAKKDRDKLAALVLDYMARETDAYAFRQMHTALGKLTGATVELPFGAAEDPEQRRAVLEQWRKTELQRRGK